MDVADLYRYMEDPSLLSEETLSELKQLVDTYPYFHTARILYLKNLAVLNDVRLEAELRKMSIYIPDRRKLFMLLEGEQYGMIPKPACKVEPKIGNSFSLIDAFLSDKEDTDADNDKEVKQEAPLLYESFASADYLNWSSTGKSTPKTTTDNKPEPEKRLNHADLIDSFLEQEEERKPRLNLNLDLDDDDDLSEAPESVQELEDSRHKTVEDSYFTETLARIYVKQKRYEKALQIIKNLSLKYPEKNVYFADQIRFLEKLIINTKK